MSTVKVNELVKEIKTGLKQTSSSQKDEVRVMQAMLNDTSYEVGVYGKEGEVEKYNPAKDYRAMCTNVVASATKMPKAEAAKKMEAYEVTKADASSMVNVSKEFMNTYLDTGRKISFGGREQSNYALSVKDIPASTKTYPKKIGIAEDGKGIYESGTKNVPAHKSIKAYGPCPSWVK